MPSERYFFEEMFQSQQIILKDQEFHHLVNVMRSSSGDNIELVNGQGELALGIIEKIEKKQASIQIERITKEPPPKHKVILAQAIPRMNRLDVILEKGTELGMSQLWLFPTERSERRHLTPHQLERMTAITIAAMKQCGRLYLPKIIIFDSLSEALSSDFTTFFGDLDPGAPSFVKALKKMGPQDDNIVFYIGPESGFKEEEINLLKKNSCVGVKLHSNILRTDTAGLAALSLMYFYTTTPL